MLLPAEMNEGVRCFWPHDGARSALPGTAVPNAVTIVTAFFDIGRDGWGGNTVAIARCYRRSSEKYLACFANLAPIQNDLVVFVEPEMAQRVLDLRAAAGLADRTTIFTIDDLFATDAVRPILDQVAMRMSDTFSRFVWKPDTPEVRDPKYVMVNALKSAFVLTAVEQGAVRNGQAAWIDFGYCRSPDIIDPEVEWTFDAKGKINLFCGAQLDDRPIFDIVRHGSVYFQGCHIVGPVEAWGPFNARLGRALDRLLKCDLIDDDQTLLLMSWREAPEAHIVHQVDLNGPLGWFFIFRRFRCGADAVCDPIGPAPVKAYPAWFREIKASLKRRKARPRAA